MNNKFMAIAASISFISMMWPVLIIDTIPEEAFLVGDEFCEDYGGVERNLEESIIGAAVLCNEWDPINKGIFGQDIKYQIHIDKDGEVMQDNIAFLMQFIIPLVIIAMLLDMKFNKKKEDDDAVVSEGVDNE